MTRLGTNVTTSHFFLTYLLARLTWAKMTRMRGSGFMMAVWWIFTFLFTFWWFGGFFHAAGHQCPTRFTIARNFLSQCARVA